MHSTLASKPKNMKKILSILLLSLSATLAKAQSVEITTGDSDEQPKKGKTSISVGTGGVRINKPDQKEKTVEVQFGMLDIGINSLIDNTNYQSAETRSFLHVNDQYVNEDLFSLRTNKSVNVNVYPVMIRANLYRSSRQKIILASGLGLQLYNFRFTKPVSYQSDPQPYVMLDSVSFAKNKLAFDFLTLPLMLNFKTKLSDGKKGLWLTYGVGLSGGYLIQSWTKQISDERGKQKKHDQFNFRNTNLCVNGELGLSGIVRLFASYQLTSMHEYGLDQHPLSIGVRFFGL